MAYDYASITPFQRVMIVASLMAAAILQALDMTIANVALPHMQGSLAASRDQISWVLTSYAVATAIGIPFAGWLAERCGRKIVMLGSVLGFMLASMACGVSESLTQIVVARTLQGLLGAGLMSLTQAAIMDSFPPHKMGLGITIFSIGTLAGTISGPTLGGLLTEGLSWRWVFYINLPIGLLALAGVAKYLPRNPPNPAKKLDVFGFVTLCLALGLFQAMLDRGEQLDWFNSVEIRLEACAALMSFCYFLTHTLTQREHSFFNRQLLSNSNYVAGIIGIAITGGILTASRAMFPLLLQGLYQYSAIYAGLVLSPSGIGALLAVLLQGRLQRRVDARLLCVAGLLLLCYSLWLMMGYNLTPGMSDIVWPSFIQGMGFMLSSITLAMLAFATLKPELRNEGTSVFSLLRNFGGGIGIAITQSVISRNGQIMHATLAEHVTAFTPYGAPPYLPAPIDLQSSAGLALMNEEVTRQAAMVGYLDAFTLLMLASLAAIPLMFLIRLPKRDAHGAEAAGAIIE